MLIKPLSEFYDSPERRDEFNLSQEEIEKLKNITPFENEFKYGLWHGNSAQLNSEIGNTLLYSKDRDTVAYIEYIYPRLLKRIPELKYFKLLTGDIDTKTHKIHFSKKAEINATSKCKTWASISFSLEFHTKGDKLLGYRKYRYSIYYFNSMEYSDNFSVSSPEDRYMHEMGQYVKRDLTMEEIFEKSIPIIRKNIQMYEFFIDKKYGVSILKTKEA